MRVAVIGSRNIALRESQMMQIIKDTLPLSTTCIVSGGARGADSFASVYAKRNNIPIIEYLPDYKLYGRKAPLVRNREIIKNADFVVALWDGRSTGTIFTVKLAVERNLPCLLFNIHTGYGNFFPPKGPQKGGQSDEE